jgi:hypothetical protein
MRGLAFHMSEFADVIPDGVDIDGVKPAVALGFGIGRKEEGVGFGPKVGVAEAFLFNIVPERPETFAADLVPVRETPLLRNDDRRAVVVDIPDIKAGGGRPAHAGFDEEIDDGAVSPGMIALTLATNAVCPPGRTWPT